MCPRVKDARDPTQKPGLKLRTSTRTSLVQIFESLLATISSLSDSDSDQSCRIESMMTLGH
eukprot:scaffold88663_cov40-Prasinocladus_malaysianus.AAC.1